MSWMGSGDTMGRFSVRLHADTFGRDGRLGIGARLSATRRDTPPDGGSPGKLSNRHKAVGLTDTEVI
jgi:hypothetical protein